MLLRLAAAVLLCSTSLYGGIIIQITPAPVTGTEGLSTGLTLLGTFTDNSDPLASAMSGTISWGDGTGLSTADITGGGGNYDLYGTHTYIEAGTYDFTLSVKDPSLSQSSNTGTANISDAALVESSAINGSGLPGTALNNLIVGSFIDNNPFAPLTDESATINWGDGTPSTSGTVTQPGGGGTAFDIVGSHTYASGGDFTITMTALDVDGSMTTFTGTEDIVGAPEPGTFLFCAAGILICGSGSRLRARMLR